jgi:ribosomal protein S18 acetylase RimI-like enzyme
MRRMSLTFNAPIEPPSLPPGFTLRPLKGQSEVIDYTAVHRAAFGTQNMTAEWRGRTVEHPYYQPDLDLVITNQEGRLVAFCIGWVAEINGGKIAQIEPLGVLPEFQGLGLGRAVLLEKLRRMRASGANKVLIDAESYNPASQHLYESVGFRDIYPTYKYFRQFG